MAKDGFYWTDELTEKVIQKCMFSKDDRNRPTEFEIYFRTQVAEYRYVLHVLNEVIVYESLDRIKMDTGRRSSLFLVCRHRLCLSPFLPFLAMF